MSGASGEGGLYRDIAGIKGEENMEEKKMA